MHVFESIMYIVFTYLPRYLLPLILFSPRFIRVVIHMYTKQSFHESY